MKGLTGPGARNSQRLPSLSTKSPNHLPCLERCHFWIVVHSGDHTKIYLIPHLEGRIRILSWVRVRVGQKIILIRFWEIAGVCAPPLFIWSSTSCALSLLPSSRNVTTQKTLRLWAGPMVDWCWCIFTYRVLALLGLVSQPCFLVSSLERSPANVPLLSCSLSPNAGLAFLICGMRIDTV